MCLFFLYRRWLVNNVSGDILSLGKLSERVKAELQRRSNKAYFGLSPKNKDRVGRAFRGTKQTRVSIGDRAVKGRKALHRMALGTDKPFKEVLVHGSDRSRDKKLVVGKSAGSIHVDKERT